MYKFLSRLVLARSFLIHSFQDFLPLAVQKPIQITKKFIEIDGQISQKTVVDKLDSWNSRQITHTSKILDNYGK